MILYNVFQVTVILYLIYSVLVIKTLTAVITGLSAWVFSVYILQKHDTNVGCEKPLRVTCLLGYRASCRCSSWCLCRCATSEGFGRSERVCTLCTDAKLFMMAIFDQWCRPKQNLFSIPRPRPRLILFSRSRLYFREGKTLVSCKITSMFLSALLQYGTHNI